MRDPNRIQAFCNQLAGLWRMVPDWRFGQLISNVFGAYIEETKRDIFYPEDDELMAFMKKYFNTSGKNNE